MKIKILIFTMLVLSVAACTSPFTVKNRALVLSAEKFDNEAHVVAKENFADLEQQKVFADFIKKNSRLDVENVKLDGDNATAELVIKTPAKRVIPELKTISVKEWQSKAAAAMETRYYSLTLKKENDSWAIVEQKEMPKK
jgi:hypothetical protein